MTQTNQNPTPGLIKKWLDKNTNHDKNRNVQDILEDIADALQGIENVANFFETLAIIAIILGAIYVVLMFMHS